ncbi:hypothetical protein HPB49_013761 [Dermacentor silvarum]|uniref:Uncharacterized protein n=1 Tax=Dermacentor silvarum TaxID=543639 RepID=A0ACB8CFA2_DERSI|nr:hypothetical protein HPB49_013761 [Dermacentor silvarum]
MSSQSTQKAYAYDVVVVPGGAGPEDVVDATASIVILEERGAQALAPYDKVINISRDVMGSRPTVTTGTRHVRIEMKTGSPVPNYLRVAGHRVTCDYRGMQRVCQRCWSSGHFRVQCTAPFCTRCGIYGHVGKGCVLPCRRCGDPHATVACSLRRTYSEAASKNFPPLQSSTHEPDLPSISSASLASTHEDAVQVPPTETPAASPASRDPEKRTTRVYYRLTHRVPGTYLLNAASPRSLPPPPPPRPALREPAEHHIPEAEPCLSVDSGPLVIDETPCQEDNATSLCSESTSSSSTRIEEDTTTGNLSGSSPDIFVSPSANNARTKRQHGSTSDSDVPSCDKSPLRASTRHRKPRASGGSPVRKKWAAQLNSPLSS